MELYLGKEESGNWHRESLGPPSGESDLHSVDNRKLLVYSAKLTGKPCFFKERVSTREGRGSNRVQAGRDEGLCGRNVGED